MAKQTRDSVVLSILNALKEGSAFDIIRAFDKDNPGMSAEEMQRFCAGVHGSCSGLYDKGKIRRVRLATNSTTGAEVYVYAVEQIQRGPRAKVEKSYKEKYESALDEIKERDERIETLLMMLNREREKVASMSATFQPPLNPEKSDQTESIFVDERPTL